MDILDVRIYALFTGMYVLWSVKCVVPGDVIFCVVENYLLMLYACIRELKDLTAILCELHELKNVGG